jgi:hypothetical protein
VLNYCLPDKKSEMNKLSPKSFEKNFTISTFAPLKKLKYYMIILPLKEGENIERALKKFKESLKRRE